MFDFEKKLHGDRASEVGALRRKQRVQDVPIALNASAPPRAAVIAVPPGRLAVSL